MAYVTGNFNLVNTATIESVAGTKEWSYLTTDSIATVIGAGYISDATKKGASKGDQVTVINTTTPSLAICQIASISAGAATLQSIAPANAGLPVRAFQSTVVLPLQLLDIATGDFKVAIPYAFTVVSALFRTAKPATTAAKAATLTVSVNGTPATGGAMALTSANQNTIGGSVAGSAITAGGTGTAGQTVGVTASAITAFIEGDGYVEFTIQNTDLSAAPI